MAAMSSQWLIIFSFLVILRPIHVSCECTCDNNDATHQDPYDVILTYKLRAIVAILSVGAVGVSLPILGKNFPAFQPESDFFLAVKAFAAGVILSTSFIHILPDAYEDLTSPCLNKGPWRRYPFTGLAAMVGSLGTLMIDALATGHFSRAHLNDEIDGGPYKIGVDEEELNGEYVALHSHHAGHAHVGGPSKGLSEFDRVKYRVTSQVLEMGIVVHSVIIGISLGTSQNLDTIKPLMAALCFHQCFEGMGLGSCIAQADFKLASTWCMGLFFSLTTPVGIAVGIGIMNCYDHNSPNALIIQGLLNACAAGILIYMALVDLLAHDFMSPKLQTSLSLFMSSNVALFLGAGLMAILGIWA